MNNILDWVTVDFLFFFFIYVFIFWSLFLPSETLYIDDLENILDEGMLSLNAMIEDGSIEEVCLPAPHLFPIS